MTRRRVRLLPRLLLPALVGKSYSGEPVRQRFRIFMRQSIPVAKEILNFADLTFVVMPVDILRVEVRQLQCF